MSQIWQLHYAPGGESLLSRAGLHASNIFDDPRIELWRDLPERQNCIVRARDGQSPRLHVKRFKPPYGGEALREANAVALLRAANILTVPLVAYGVCEDGRGFLISEDLSGYQPADRVLKEQTHSADLPERIADLAWQLHMAHLHHRDFYLCHVFVAVGGDQHRPLHLIDPGRVARMPPWPMHYRWMVKDVAQLYYSVTDAGLSVSLRGRIISRYLERSPRLTRWLCRIFVPLKARFIARHDANLRRQQPGRRVSLDDATHDAT